MGASPGVPLAQYARVQAAIAEPFPLDEVLAHFGIKKRAWSRAEKTWGELLAMDPTLLDTYRRELDAAVDELARRVRPIDDDPAAWLSFLDAYGREPAPFVWLERHDLGMNDLARLKRLWERRVAADAGLAQRLPTLRREAEGKPPPKIVADPRRRPGTNGAAVCAPGGAAPVPPPALDSLTYAALLAELDVWPEHRSAVLKDRGIDEEALAGITGWYLKRFEEVPDERRDFEHLRAHHRERVSRARDAQPNRVGPATPPSAIQSVALELPVMRIPTVDELERTAELGDAASATLPFREATEHDVERMAAELLPRPWRGNSDPYDATSEAELGRQGAVLPFFRPGEEALDGTVEVSGADVAAPLPFRPSNAPSTLVSGSVEPKPRSRSGATEDLPQIMSRGAMLPFMIARGGAAAAPLLTLEQHASLTVELTLASDRKADVLARYQLTPAEKAAVDAHYRAAMQDPAVHAQWRGACDVYLKWLVAARK